MGPSLVSNSLDGKEKVLLRGNQPTIINSGEYTNEFLMKEGERSGGSLGAGVSQFRSLGLLHPGVLDSLCLIGHEALSLDLRRKTLKNKQEKRSVIYNPMSVVSINTIGYNETTQ